MDLQKIEHKLKKLKPLAERGVGGEAVNARMLYEKLKKQRDELLARQRKQEPPHRNTKKLPSYDRNDWRNHKNGYFVKIDGTEYAIWENYSEKYDNKYYKVQIDGKTLDGWTRTFGEAVAKLRDAI